MIMGNYLGACFVRSIVMVGNEHAALRLAHPTVVPEEAQEDDDEPDTVDTTGTHPTVRAAPMRGD